MVCVMVAFKLPTKFDYFKTDAISNLEILKKCLNLPNFFAKMLGVDILSPGFTFFSAPFVFIIFNFLLGIVVHIYDLYLYREDVSQIFFILGTGSGVIKAIVRINVFTSYRANIYDHLARAESFLTNSITEAADRIFAKWMLMLCHMSALVAALVFIFCVAVMAYPIIVYFVTGTRVLHFGFELPFIDWQNSLIGYSLNFIWCCYLIYAQVMLIFLCVLLFTFPIIVNLGQFEVIQSLLEELDELIKGNQNNCNDKRIKKYIAIITETHNDLLE